MTAVAASLRRTNAFTAAASRLRTLRTALGGFLRGFLGIGGSGERTTPASHAKDAPSPAAARAALTVRAAGRRSCC